MRKYLAKWFLLIILTALTTYSGITIAGDPKGKSESEGKIVKSDKEWRKELTPDQYQICRQKGTERAFTGKYWNHKEKGQYVCVACRNLLFDSETKYDSGSGWPSFFTPHREESVDTKEDNSLFMKRVEIVCSKCDSHLGHVFDDGPKPTGKRYCVNSASLDFIPADGEKQTD